MNFFTACGPNIYCGLTSMLSGSCVLAPSEGLVDVNMTEILLEEVEVKFSKFFGIQFGGQWRPKDCRPRWKVRHTPS